METVKAWQKKKIYAIASSLKYVDRNDKGNDILHMIIYNRIGKDSVKDLTYQEAQEIIQFLELQQDKSLPEKMSEGQKKKVFSLMYQLKDLDAVPNSAPIGERLAGIIERQFKVRSTPKYLFTNLSHDDGNKLIEILKNYIGVAERKYMN